MRRWNGWGDPDVNFPLPKPAIQHLERSLGILIPIPDVDFAQACDQVPASLLKDHPLVDRGAPARVCHARGQSLPDWVALRHGLIGTYPDGVARPSETSQVRELLDLAARYKWVVIPYGGGTSVVGHINPLPEERAILTVDMTALKRLIAIDPYSQLATFETGVRGPSLEDQLRNSGLTLGHYPQSFEYSTLGGWIATRSTGQQSYYYGRIEQLFAGGRLETPAGSLELPPHPASAAGPDLRQLVLGSEGRLGILTQATVRVRRLPEAEEFYGLYFHDWESGIQAVREAVQASLGVSMLRLSDPAESAASLIFSRGDRQVNWADRSLRLLGYGQDRCMLIFAVTGDHRQVSLVRSQAKGVFRAKGGLFLGRILGDNWRKSRFRSPYLRNTLWEIGVAVDTLETAVKWEGVTTLSSRLQDALMTAAAGFNERVLVFTHLSHVYPDGASIYVTFLFRRSQDPDQLLARWQAMKTAASHVIQDSEGTISHQHGVGYDHIPYMGSEKGQLGLVMLRSLSRALDPHGLLNPGKLIPP